MSTSLLHRGRQRDLLPVGVCDDPSRVTSTGARSSIRSRTSVIQRSRGPSCGWTTTMLSAVIGVETSRVSVLAGGVGSADPPRRPHVVVDGHGGPVLRPGGAAAERGRGGPSRVLDDGARSSPTLGGRVETVVVAGGLRRASRRPARWGPGCRGWRRTTSGSVGGSVSVSTRSAPRRQRVGERVVGERRRLEHERAPIDAGPRPPRRRSRRRRPTARSARRPRRPARSARVLHLEASDRRGSGALAGVRSSISSSIGRPGSGLVAAWARRSRSAPSRPGTSARR